MLPFPEPLYEKYRPHSIDGFIGLHKPKRILETFVRKPFATSFIFIGPSGTGKTTLALAISEEINAEFHHIPSRKCNLDEVDKVCGFCSYIPFRGGLHLVLVDEADQMTPDAQKAFLSRLDSTGRLPQTIFIFTCNSTKSLEGRFLSRCTKLYFETESIENSLAKYLARIYRKEGGRYRVNFDKVAKDSHFNIRDALNTIQTEIMIGSRRGDLPKEKAVVAAPEHIHSCPECSKTYKHADPLCELPYRNKCQACGGVMSAASARAKKAWVTMRKQRRKEKQAAVRKAIARRRGRRIAS